MSNNLLKSYLWVKYSLEKKKYDNLRKQVWNCISTNDKYSLNNKKTFGNGNDYSSDEDFFNDSVNNDSFNTSSNELTDYSYYQNNNINYNQTSLLSGPTTIGTINERLSKLQKWINSDSDKYSLQKIKEYIFNILLLLNIQNNQSNITEQVLTYSINTYSNIYAYYKKNNKILKNPIKSAFIVLIIKKAIFEITKKEIDNSTILKYTDYDNQKIRNKIPEATIIFNKIFN